MSLPPNSDSKNCQCYRFREKVRVSHQYYFLPKNTVRSMYKVLHVRRRRTAQSVSRPCLVFRIFRIIVSVVCLPGFCPEFSKNAVRCLSLRSDKDERELSGLSVSRFKLSDELPRDWPYAKMKQDSNQSLSYWQKHCFESTHKLNFQMSLLFIFHKRNKHPYSVLCTRPARYFVPCALTPLCALVPRSGRSYLTLYFNPCS